MVTHPETLYAAGGGVHVAYQLFGDGPQNLVVVRDSSCPVDLMWEEPSLERFRYAIKRACDAAVLRKARLRGA